MSGLSSDLAMTVREDRGLAYTVGAYQQAGLDPGMFVFYAGTRDDAAGEVEKLMAAQVARLGREGLRAEELERARRQVIADRDMDMQDNGSLAMTCALDELYGLGYAHALSARERFGAITAQNVRAVAGALFPTNRMAVSVVLPERGQAAGK
jgi:zinc protease